MRFQAQGVEVVAVTFSPPARLGAFLRDYPLAFALLSDPTLAGYRYFALARAPWWSFLRPSLWVRFLRLLIRGWLPGLPAKGDDVMQLGGDFIVDAHVKLAFARPSLHPGDRPGVVELLTRLAAVTPQ